MASTINASTSGGGGIISTADASGTLTLQGAGNTGLSIDSSGNATGTTQSQANNSTRIGTTAYVDRVAVQQVVSTITGTVATGTTQIPLDNTIPQNTEGDQYMTLSITPKSATSKLVITVTAIVSNNNAAWVTVALFQDSTANALAVSTEYNSGATGITPVVFRYVMTSGTTSATTFKVRAGSNLASATSTVTFNGNNQAQLFGGAAASSIIITEIGV